MTCSKSGPKKKVTDFRFLPLVFRFLPLRGRCRRRRRRGSSASTRALAVSCRVQRCSLRSPKHAGCPNLSSSGPPLPGPRPPALHVDDVLREWAARRGHLLEAPVASRFLPLVFNSSPSGGGAAARRRRGSERDSRPRVLCRVLRCSLRLPKLRKMPESLVERSAKARAKSAGGSVDDVLLEWAKKRASMFPTPRARAQRGSELPTGPEARVPTSTSPRSLEELVDSSDVGPAPKVDDTEPGRSQSRSRNRNREVPASPRVRYPAWLAAVLIIIPLLAVLYVVVVPNQPTCGSAGQLAIDPATGNAVGCDGGEYGDGRGQQLLGWGRDLRRRLRGLSRRERRRRRGTCHGRRGGARGVPGGGVRIADRVDHARIGRLAGCDLRRQRHSGGGRNARIRRAADRARDRPGHALRTRGVRRPRRGDRRDSVWLRAPTRADAETCSEENGRT